MLVTGATGSGKSTTLAAMVDYLNRTQSIHIITLEDPIEFVHQSHQALINQREVGDHTETFKDALRSALRQDPDVVLVGELRDQETIQLALEVANTGHLVFGTLHTMNAISSIDRIVDIFPAEQQNQIDRLCLRCCEGLFRKRCVRSELVDGWRLSKVGGESLWQDRFEVGRPPNLNPPCRPEKDLGIDCSESPLPSWSEQMSLRMKKA